MQGFASGKAGPVYPQLRLGCNAAKSMWAQRSCCSVAVMPAVVIRQRKPWRRKDGVFLYFEDNAGVIVNPKGEMKGGCGSAADLQVPQGLHGAYHGTACSCTSVSMDEVSPLGSLLSLPRICQAAHTHDQGLLCCCRISNHRTCGEGVRRPVAAHRLSCQFHCVGCVVVTGLTGWMAAPRVLWMFESCQYPERNVSSRPGHYHIPYWSAVHKCRLQTPRLLIIWYHLVNANTAGILINNYSRGSHDMTSH